MTPSKNLILLAYCPQIVCLDVVTAVRHWRDSGTSGTWLDFVEAIKTRIGRGRVEYMLPILR